VAADHHAIRVHEVLDGGTLAEKFGVRDDLGAVLSIALAQDPGDHIASERGHRRLVDHDQRAVHAVGDRGGGCLDV